ncbi:conserved hypothetical protein [Theileria orientalis strain Shintoku]|uniref:RAP domain-containing protein n=1 Tax=Theileria orientalis strain Shintoku TaxID=869250 RepID=J4CDF5_THEOR|nr:conserved hypothetical protein [Theileria orientalis strain Shintoku]PVC50620.1 hypothetical protein MACL_00002152 [Theileria orientalis]BAM41052.1 conserved hypothetical protein [Theileria orientalis strain Shintoku]|eukprot:XP_009691353.1 conserved hypothetical protein [Theileria orientalis strain Shintoku]
MYNNLKFISGRKIFPIIEHNNLLTKCTNFGLNNLISNCKIVNNTPIRYFSTYISKNPTLKDDFAQSYLITREVPEYTGSTDELNKSLVNKLEDLSKDLVIKLDSIPFELNYTDLSYNVVSVPNNYPYHSHSTEGSISLQITNNELWTESQRENRIYGIEKNILYRKIKPSTMLLSDRYIPERYKHRYKRGEEDIDQGYATNLFEKNIIGVIREVNAKDAIKLIRCAYLLKIPVGYERMCYLLSLVLSTINTLSTKEIVELAVCVRSYVDNDNSYLKFYLLAIGSILEDRCQQLKLLPQQSLIDYMLPLALMQFGEHPISWSILLNHEILDKITERFHSLDEKYMANLLVILSSLEQCPDVSNKYYRVYESLVNCLKNALHAVGSNGELRAIFNFDAEIMNMLNMPILFPNLEVFRESLFKQVLERSKEFSVNSLAMIYLKHKDEIPKEYSNDVLNMLNKTLLYISPKYVPDLYCCYLKRGEFNAKDNSNYEHYLIMNYKTLSIKNISNVLMYLSINGKSKCTIYSWIIKRFQMLRLDNKVNNQELLDVVLSMSLVGIQNINVWNRLNLGNLIYQTPKNILVYLGYSFLITNYGDRNSWKVLLERILLENKHFNPETYEVIKAAQLLEYIPTNTYNPRLYYLLNQCRSLYITKLARQRHTSPVPYEKMFDKMAIKYKKRVILNDLYEAYYVLPEFNIILDITKDPIKHPTSGTVVGEAVLRHHVWNKMNYRTFTFDDAFWDEFKREDEKGVVWNIDKMVVSFSKFTRLYHLKNRTVERRSPILQTKGRDDRGNAVLRTLRNAMNTKNTSERSSRIKRLQSILYQKSSD